VSGTCLRGVAGLVQGDEKKPTRAAHLCETLYSTTRYALRAPTTDPELLLSVVQ